jgi:hypothetical protein
MVAPSEWLKAKDDALIATLAVPGESGSNPKDNDSQTSNNRTKSQQTTGKKTSPSRERKVAKKEETNGYGRASTKGATRKAEQSVARQERKAPKARVKGKQSEAVATAQSKGNVGKGTSPGYGSNPARRAAFGGSAPAPQGWLGAAGSAVAEAGKKVAKVVGGAISAAEAGAVVAIAALGCLGGDSPQPNAPDRPCGVSTNTAAKNKKQSTPATASATNVEENENAGYATLYYWSSEAMAELNPSSTGRRAPPHFAVETTINGTSFATEQFAPSPDHIYIVPVSQEVLDTATGKARIDLPNTANARLFQETSIVAGDCGTYHPRSNSCSSHVIDVLNAGGLPILNRGDFFNEKFPKPKP